MPAKKTPELVLSLVGVAKRCDRPIARYGHLAHFSQARILFQTIVRRVIWLIRRRKAWALEGQRLKHKSIQAIFRGVSRINGVLQRTEFLPAEAEAFRELLQDYVWTPRLFRELRAFWSTISC